MGRGTHRSHWLSCAAPLTLLSQTDMCLPAFRPWEHGLALSESGQILSSPLKVMDYTLMRYATWLWHTHLHRSKETHCEHMGYIPTHLTGGTATSQCLGSGQRRRLPSTGTQHE